MLELNKIHQGDCLEVMKQIDDNSIDMILCDLPYGITSCKWDSQISLGELWKEYNRIIKDNRAILLFGTEPFSSLLRINNLKMYKYDWKWDKLSGSNFTTAKYQPLRVFEDILVFNINKSIYNPQMEKRDKNKMRISGKSRLINNSITGLKNQEGKKSSIFKYPINKLVFDRCGNELNSKYRVHPTQKPVALFEYLIKTYTNEGMLVLDNCIGSGTTAVACINTKRNFIGIELEPKYVEIANKRIQEAQAQTKLVVSSVQGDKGDTK